jgi:protoporphyrinogen IX oxidase
MGEVIAVAYDWIKAAHVIFVIFWMAGLFMLPRFFVYHQEAAVDSPENKLWIERERRLLTIILNPAMFVVWGLGLVLAWQSGAFAFGWFWLKLLSVFTLSGYHGWMAGYAKKLSRGERALSGKTLRLANEVPGVATAIIVVLVIVKPF